jgi:choline dehydrogenase
VQAGIECQLPENPDFNGASQDGVGLYQVTQQDGQRFSSARAFLDPVRSRENLSIETGVQVERVLFENRRAIGLRVMGRDIFLRPGGEVIVCGGAVNSPQLLMLSGIGPGAELSRHGIDVLHDAGEVGANLADHLDIGVLASTRGREAIGVAPGLLPRVIRSAWAYAKAQERRTHVQCRRGGGLREIRPRTRAAEFAVSFPAVSPARSRAEDVVRLWRDACMSAISCRKAADASGLRAGTPHCRRASRRIISAIPTTSACC